MSLGYRTANGELISLRPLGAVAGRAGSVPTLALSGREDAAMSSGRVLRAAQAHFEYPVSVGDGTTRAGTRSVASDELPALLKHKRFEVFEDGDSGLLRLAYRELVLRFRADARPAHIKQVLRDAGLKLRQKNAFVDRQFIVTDDGRERSTLDMVALALQLSENPALEFATPNFVSQYSRSATGAAPRLGKNHWHLKMVRAAQAWALTKGKASVTIAVLDDGVDVDHPELKPRLRRKPDAAEKRDLFGRDFFVPDTAADHFDPRPKRFRMPFDRMTGNDIHGTCCAGVAAGAGPRGPGLAPGCRILPVKVFHADDLAADSRVADALRYSATFAQVLSCSWGGSRNPDLEAAIADAANGGRGGKGTVIVCATGNESAPKVSYPASDPHCIAVGASTDQRLLADYSNRGPQVWVVAPSSGGTRGIFATDLSLPGRGFNTGMAAVGGADGLFCNDFGGTSSATPLVAGLVGLMLSLRPSLSLAQVKDLLARSAVKIDPAGAAYGATGHSLAYGHGMVNAEAALKAVKAA